jgi:hypothetical protein
MNLLIRGFTSTCQCRPLPNCYQDIVVFHKGGEENRFDYDLEIFLRCAEIGGLKNFVTLERDATPHQMEQDRKCDDTLSPDRPIEKALR